MKAYMYILECADGSFYTGSTDDLERRIAQHQTGEGANYTKKHLPVKLVYVAEFQSIEEAFQREKQVQGWSRKKKLALIQGEYNLLPELSRTKEAFAPSTGSGSEGVSGSEGGSGSAVTGSAAAMKDSATAAASEIADGH